MEKVGHWIDDYGNQKCSKCGTSYPDLYPDYFDAAYCPHCGYCMKEKKMSKEEMLKKIELIDCAFDFDELYDSEKDEWFDIHDLFFQIKEIIAAEGTVEDHYETNERKG